MIIYDDIKWHQETEIAVLGFGLAGGAAAITAHDAGAKVIILEKQESESHQSNSSLSGAMFLCPDDVDAAIRYMEQLSKIDEDLSWTDSDTIKIWAQYTAQNKDWLEKLGGRIVPTGRVGEHPQVEGYKNIKVYSCAGMGWGMMKLIEQNLTERSIPILYGTPASRLLTNVSGEVIGVRATRQGEDFNIRTSKAVILTTGGFEYNEDMKLNNLKIYPSYFTGTPANTGDGIIMAQEIGASLWHMNCISGGAVGKVADFPVAFKVDFSKRKTLSQHEKGASVDDTCGYIVVNKFGQRFTNEVIKSHSFYYALTECDTHNLEFTRVPSYWIFDSRRMKVGNLPSLYAAILRKSVNYSWSWDNQKEVDQGWIIQGNSVGELADNLKLDAAVLENTVSAYNESCKNRQDNEFHRPAHCLIPLDEPPYYAFPLWPGGPNTQGGPRRNSRGQILNTGHKPIPRLYGAGECGSIYGMYYPATGGNLAECIAFGRIAAENAVLETDMS